MPTKASMRRSSSATATITKPMTFHAFTFEVEGEGRFPMELLGMDFCMPSNSTQYLIAFTMHAGKRKVELIGFRNEDAALAPSLERWSESGWPVRETTIRVVPQ